MDGRARCPFDATQSNVAIFAGTYLNMEEAGMRLESAYHSFSPSLVSSVPE